VDETFDQRQPRRRVEVAPRPAPQPETSVIEAFILVFAAWTLRGDGEEDGAEERPARSHGSALLAVGGAFLVAELGDKTMLATLTIAATAEPIGTWLGASTGMIAANVLAIVVGAFLGARLPERTIRVPAAGAFAVFGVILILEGLGVL
jgi:putative Ca2+/H+ antiporter (TMEM165/GDT1 family)